jgi:hypothetical protein
VIEYRYHSSWWYWYSTVRDIGDNCDRVQVSLILEILIQYSQIYHSYHLCLWLYCISITNMSDTCTLSQFSPLSLTVLYEYHQDERYLHSITVITYVSDYCISITKMSDTSTLSQLSPMSLTVLYQYHQDEWYLRIVRDIGDNCDRVQVSLILVILIQYSQRHRW